MDTQNAHPSDPERIHDLVKSKNALLNEIGKKIVGQEGVIDLLLTSLFAKGHCLFVGVPGLAKTLLIQTLAESLSLSFSRIQFTPDLMPADITGTDVLDIDEETGKRSFRFLEGPLFANLILADEINRTPPKTQAALLQAMQESALTVGGKTHQLGTPFGVFATQNPIEQEGTYPLPEAQLDRFMFQVPVSYPTEEEENKIVQRTTGPQTKTITPVLTPQQVVDYQNLITRVPASEHVIRYAVAVTRASRPKNAHVDSIKNYVSWGAGPRASQYLILAAKTKAALDGRHAVSTDDVKSLADPVLGHRMILNYRAEAENISTHDLIAEAIQKIELTN